MFHIHYLIVVGWCIYVAVNSAIIDSGNGFSSIWRQAIIWTNQIFLLITHLGIDFSEIWLKIL